jgi:hypothetical protein
LALAQSNHLPAFGPIANGHNDLFHRSTRIPVGSKTDDAYRGDPLSKEKVIAPKVKTIAKLPYRIECDDDTFTTKVLLNGDNLVGFAEECL